MTSDAAAIVEVYHPSSKPNAPIQMERAPVRSLASLSRKPHTVEPVKHEYRVDNEEENIFGLAQKQVRDEFDIPGLSQP